MKQIQILFFLSISSLLITSCGRMDNEEIKKSWWKYGSGYHISDRLDFDDRNLKGDTIYSNNKPIAIILSCGKEIFQSTAVLEIKELTKGEIGTYHEK